MIVGSIILAGGRSRRMGRPKESLRFGDSTLLGKTVDTLLTCCHPVIVVARDAEQELPPITLEAEVTFDSKLDQGPLIGIQTGMRAAGNECDVMFVTGCDTPFLEAGAVDWLTNQLGDHDVVMAQIDDKLQPLGAIYRMSILPTIDSLVEEGVQTPRTLAERCKTRILDAATVDAFDPKRNFLRNLNSPEDYEAAIRESGTPT